MLLEEAISSPSGYPSLRFRIRTFQIPALRGRGIGQSTPFFSRDQQGGRFVPDAISAYHNRSKSAKNVACVSIRNFRFSFQQPHTIYRKVKKLERFEKARLASHD